MKTRIVALVGFAVFATSSATSHAAPFVITNYPFTQGYISYSASLDPGFFLQTGDFLTIYDAGQSPTNVTGDLANSKLFTITTNLVDVPALFTVVPDDPTISNLRFTYIGTANLSDSSLGGFRLSDPSNTFRFVTEQSSLHNGAGLQEATDTQAVPPVPAPVPEPSTLTLMSTAMLGLAGAAKRRFRRT